MLWQPIIHEDDPHIAFQQRRFLNTARAVYDEYKPPSVLTKEFIYNNAPITEADFASQFQRLLELFHPIDLDAVGDRFAHGTLIFWHETTNRERADKLHEYEVKSLFPMIDSLIKTDNALLARHTFAKERLPFAKQLIKELKCKPNELYDRVKDWKLGLHRTVEEWYNLYKDRYTQHLAAKRLEETVEDIPVAITQTVDKPPRQPTKGENAQPLAGACNACPRTSSTKGQSKYAFKPIVPARVPHQTKKPNKKDNNTPNPNPKKDERPTYDKDVIPYPFKSKLKQYQKNHPDVDYVDVPEQPKVQYKLLQRPYFSNTIGAWEIDHCFDMLETGDAYLFCVNVNTRYLVVYKCEKHNGHKENASETFTQLEKFIRKFKPKSIRGDGSSAYLYYGKDREYLNRVITPQELREEFNELKISTNSLTHRLMQLYMNNNITIYFNSSPFTLHNKIVDVAIKTIRNAIGYRRMKPEHMDQLIDYYNNTVHKSIGCTPAEMQSNPELEYQYIRWCERKLSEVIKAQREQQLLEYQPGNVLMVHIDKGKTSEKHEKRRRFFDKLGEFVRYDHGNVVVRLLVKDVRVNTRAKPKTEITVPIYHTRFVSKNIRTIPPEYKDYYINSMKAIEVDDDMDKNNNDNNDITPVTPA